MSKTYSFGVHVSVTNAKALIITDDQFDPEFHGVCHQCERYFYKYDLDYDPSTGDYACDL